MHIGIEVAVVGVVVVVQRELITVGVSALRRRLGGGLEKVQNPQFSGVVSGLKELVDAFGDGLDAEVLGYLFRGDQVLSHGGVLAGRTTVIRAAARRNFYRYNFIDYSLSMVVSAFCAALKFLIRSEAAALCSSVNSRVTG